MKRFYTVNGCNGSSLRIYEEFKKKLKAKGPTEVTSSDQCDFILAFCPISTRAGIDIQETMEMCPDGKPVILVVLHHTYDHEKFVPPMARIVMPSKIILSVNCMFYGEKMLKCAHNEREFHKILAMVGPTFSTVTHLKIIFNRTCYWLIKPKRLVFFTVLAALCFFYQRQLRAKSSILSKDSTSIWNSGYIPQGHNLF